MGDVQERSSQLIPLGAAEENHISAKGHRRSLGGFLALPQLYA